AAADIRLTPAYFEQSHGFRRASLVDRSVGSVHMGLGLCVLETGGHIDRHVHSFEESFFVLEGEPTLVLDGRAYPLMPGACGVVPVSVPHAWLLPALGVARCFDTLAPQPGVGGKAHDPFFVGPAPTGDVEAFDIRDPRSRHLFR